MDQRTSCLTHATARTHIPQMLSIWRLNQVAPKQRISPHSVASRLKAVAAEIQTFSPHSLLFALLRYLALTNSYGANYEILSLITLICDLSSSLCCGKGSLQQLGQTSLSLSYHNETRDHYVVNSNVFFLLQPIFFPLISAQVEQCDEGNPALCSVKTKYCLD